MACSGAYATPAEYNDLLCAGLDLTDADTLAMVTNALALAASDAHAALAASNQCTCTPDAWAVVYLKKLNIVDAAVLQHCPCGNAVRTQEERDRLQEWLEGQYELIRTSATVICQGATGIAYPAFGIAQYSHTDWNYVQIIFNRWRRTP
jgi:hypothetical protein